MRAKKIFLLLSLFFSFYTGICQDGELQFYQNGFYIKQYSEISGLVSNRCKNTFEDSRGFLWVYTFKGLSRFDGKQFVNFGINEGLPESNIIQVSEDSLGFIYVATTTGIARYTGYDKTTGRYFYVYPQTKGFDVPIAGMQAVDSNTIIFQQGNGRVLLLQRDRITQLAPASTGEGGLSILRKGFDYYYAYVKDTMRVFDARFKNIGNIYNEGSEYTDEANDNSGTIHIYCKGTKRKIQGKDIVYTSAVPDSIIWFDCLDTIDRMIYFKAGSIYYYKDQKSLKIVDLRALSLNSNSITAAKDGSIWVATSSGGLFRLTPLSYTNNSVASAADYFFYYRSNKRMISTDAETNAIFPALQTDQWLKDLTESILVDKKGVAWFCTRNGIYKKDRGKEPVLYTFPGKTSFWNENANRIVDAVEAPGGDIWFYGFSGAVQYRNGKFKHYNHSTGLAKSQGRIRDLAINKDGDVFLIDHYSRLLRVQGDTIVLVTDLAGIPAFGSDKIKTDGNGNIWMEYNKKLYKIQRQSAGSYAITDSIKQSPFYIVPEIKSFDFDMLGNCWIGYAGGKLQVFFMDTRGRYDYTNSLTYTIDVGLAPTAAYSYSLCPNDIGNMILVPSAQQGDKKLFVFSVKDAMERKKMAAPQLSLTEILINHEAPDWTLMEYETGAMGIPLSCKLSYADNNIIFNYTGVSLSNPSSIVYQTMLKGYDTKWRINAGTMASYTNLPPGKYTFLVKTANANGAWSDAYEYPFTISPPWYKTWWATLLWIVVCSSIILFLVFLRINSIRMSNLKENNMFKSSLIGLIGHDMMTPLRYIAKVSSQLKTYNNKLSRETTLDSLGDITVTASRLQFFGESILHWINLQNSEYSPAMDRFHVNKTIGDLVEFHQLLAVEKGNSISHEIPDDLFCYQDPTLVKIIVHNLLLNANKFTTNGKIGISAAIEKEWLVIKVKDTGRGMDQDKVNSLNQFQPIISSPGTFKEKGWGMGYKMIIDLLKFSDGKLRVKSKLNEGTEVIIKLFSGKTEYSQRLIEIYNN